MLKFILRQNINEKMPEANGLYYAYPMIDETIDLLKLTEHMEAHNSGYSQALCMGVILAMRKCIKEQVLAGKSVKIDGLCIFSLGIKNKEGAKTPAEFSVSKNISGVKLRCRSTGDFSTQNLNLEATLKRATTVSGATDSDAPKPSTPSGGGSQGSGGQGSTSPTTPGGSGSSGSSGSDGDNTVE